MGRKALAELIGTFWLVFGGVGSVVLWSDAGPIFSVVNVALAFGLTVVTMAYAVGHISGAHLNPAVTIGLTAAGRFDAKDAPMYIGAQLIGGFIAALVLYVMAKNMNPHADHLNIGANDYHKGQILSAILAEFILTMMFLVVILGATSKRAPAGMAGLVIGLCLALIHMIGIAVTGVSVNPARSLGPAIFSGTDFIKHVWLFIVVPPAGAVVGAMIHKQLEPDSNG
jgi:aquaporin Z